MKFEFSEHSLERIKKRQITKGQIFQTIISFDETSGSYRSRKLFRKRFDDKILEIVTIKENSKIVIITAYYLNEN